MLLHAWLGNPLLHLRFQCHVVSLGAGTDMAIELQSAGAAVHILEGGQEPTSLRGGTLALLRLLTCLQRLRPDCVHGIGAAAAFLAPAAARLARVPRVFVTPRSELRTAAALRLLLGGALRGADVVTASNGDEASRLAARHGIHPRRLRLLPAVVAPHRCSHQVSLPVLPGNPRVVMLANFHEQDDLAWVAESVAILRRYHSNLELSAYGSGVAGRRLMHAAQRAGCAEHVHLPGPTDDPAGVLMAADVFLNARVTDHAPLALLEAMALGRPVVSLVAPGLQNVCEDGVHALLVPAGNPALVADAIDRVLNDATLRDGLVLRARELVARDFAPGPAVEALAQCYAESLELVATFAV